MKKPLVSIIIVNFNGAPYLRNCLNSIKKIKRPSFEVIIVDNNSTDASGKLITSFARTKNIPVKTIFNDQNYGFCHANNQGVAQAQGRYLLFLNNDTEVGPDLLKKLINRLKRDKKIGIVQPKILLKDEPGNLDSVGGFLTWTGFLKHLAIHEKDRGQYDQEFIVLSPKGACMLMEKRLFHKVGGFDEEFFAYFEETDLAWRVWLTGKQVVFYPMAAIDHLMGRTTRQLNFEFIQFHSFKNRIATLIKNVDTPSLWRVIVHVTIVILLALLYTLTGRFRSAKPIFRAVWWNTRNVPKTLAKRRAVQRMRRVNDQFLQSVSQPLSIRKVFHDITWFARH